MDSDLNSLLDDALSDFDKPVFATFSNNDSSIQSSSKQTIKTSKPETDTHCLPLQPNLIPPADVFKEFFNDEMSEKLQKEWIMAMKELSEESPQLMEQVLKVNSAAQNNTSSSSTSNGQKSDFNEAMKKTLKSLSKSMKDNDSTELDSKFMQEFANMGLPFGEGGEGMNELGMMEDIMKSMLSKEMMYPPIKELCKKYPKWLKENDSKLTDLQRKNYQKQLDCLNQVCKEFESEDSENQFEKIMDLVNRMQQYGDPPEELAAKNNPMINSGETCVIS